MLFRHHASALAAMLLIGSLSAQALAGPFPQDDEQPVIGRATIVVADEARILSPFAGTIEYLVDDREEVEKGDLLIRLSNPDLVQSISRTEIDLERLNAEYAAARASGDGAAERMKAEIALAESNVERAELKMHRLLADDGELVLERTRLESRLKLTKRQVDLYERWLELLDPEHRDDRIQAIEIELKRAEAQVDVVTTQAELAFFDAHQKGEMETSARSEIREALISLNSAQENLRQHMTQHDAVRAALEASLSDANNTLVHRQKQLDSCEIRAPYSGTVLLGSRRPIGEVGSPAPQQGATVRQRQALMVVLTNDMLEAHVEARDRQGRIKIEEGQTVTLIIDALPDRQLTGTISRDIQLSGRRESGVQFASFTVELGGNNEQLDGVLPGMTGTVKFESVDQ